MHGEFFGVSSGAREPVYARAAVLNEDGPRPSLSSDLLVEAYRRFKRGEEETDLILVASDAALALLVAMPPGLVRAGVVAEQPMRTDGSAEPTIPIISGLMQAREQISEGDLVILDPDLSRILVEPDAEEFARLQADRNRRPRLHIDASHVLARTQTGRTVAVWASVRTDEDLGKAIEFGADGIVIADDSPLTDPGFVEFGEIDPDEHAAILLKIVDRVGGGDVTIIADPSQIDPAVVFQIASRCSLRWAVGTDSLLVSSAELRSELELILAECISDDSSPRRHVPSMPRLSALVQSSDALELDLTAFDELLIPVDIAASLTIADTFELPPLRVVIDSGLAGLPTAFAIGADVIVVEPHQVLETKDFVRAQEY